MPGRFKTALQRKEGDSVILETSENYLKSGDACVVEQIKSP